MMLPLAWRTITLAALLIAIIAVPARSQPYPNARTGENYMHNYLLPPAASSSPWWPTWAPDGRSIAFAMDGALWRMQVAGGRGDGVAEAILQEKEYLSSPEWSPDGRFLAYTADDGGKSINIRVLNLATRVVTAVTTGAFVNIEPAWSPDGRRLAYVTTAPNGFFNIAVVDIVEGRPGPPLALTVDHKYGAPRLYFSDEDIHLSPSWSPDGRELLLVSNRGIPLGSGGVWRVALERDVMNTDRAKLIHTEETLFRTRPQWSPDGKRLIYASHLGGQFTNLFVLPTTGGEPYKMTFGEHDTFMPRWSPDGEWIVAVSNERGLPQIKFIKAWGGEAHLALVTRKKWLTPMGRLDVRILDERGRETEARVYHTASDGKPYTPADAYERIATLERRLFHTRGRYSTEAPPGAFRIEVTKGFEYAVARQDVDIKAGRTTTVTVRLKRLVNLKAKGWYSGSNHVHMNYAGNLHNTPENVMMMNAAEDADMVSLQIANKDNRVLDYQHYTPGQDQHPLSTRTRVMHVGQEYRPPFYGHISLFNLKEHLISPFVTGYEGTAVESLYPSNTDILRYARAQGGIGAYVHPFADDADPLSTGLGTAKAFPVDVALGAVSYHELWSQSAGNAPLDVWYKVLNNGFRVPVTGGEDSISNLHRVELVGSVRGYFHFGDAPLTWANWMKALLAGRGFVSNGPLIELTANGKVMPGEEIALPSGGGPVTFQATITSLAPLTRVELVSNGVVVHGIDVPAGKSSITFSHTAQVSRSAWFSLRAVGAPNTFPVENTRPLAVTNPIYVISGGAPIRDKASADYFVKWIDVLTDMAGKHSGWRSDKEKAHVLGQFREARDIYRARGAEAN
jgi:Tol biopolymer transport system component